MSLCVFCGGADKIPLPFDCTSIPRTPSPLPRSPYDAGRALTAAKLCPNFPPFSDADRMSHIERLERGSRQGQRRKHQRWSGQDHFHYDSRLGGARLRNDPGPLLKSEPRGERDVPSGNPSDPHRPFCFCLPTSGATTPSSTTTASRPRGCRPASLPPMVGGAATWRCWMSSPSNT